MPGMAGAPTGIPPPLLVFFSTIGADRSLICVTFFNCFPFVMSPSRPAYGNCQLSSLLWHTTMYALPKSLNILYPLLQQAAAPQEEEDSLLEEVAVVEEALPSWAEEGEVEEALYG